MCIVRHAYEKRQSDNRSAFQEVLSVGLAVAECDDATAATPIKILPQTTVFIYLFI